ncbi:hypothetical protein HDZ31DRAFT_77775, partial [Schizophyllum fasciatum]
MEGELPQVVSFLDYEMNINTKPELLLQALQMQKGRANELEDEKRALRRELANRDNEEIPSMRRQSKKGRGKRRRVENLSDAENDEPDHGHSDSMDDERASEVHGPDIEALEKAGRKMFVVGAPWIPKDLLDDRSDPVFDAGSRFDSKAMMREGLLHDALLCIPDHLRNEVHHQPLLRKAFLYGLNTLRRGTRTRLRTEIESAIVALVSDHVEGGLSTSDLSNSEVRYDKLRHLIGYNEQTKAYDNWDVAVLHGNWARTFSRESREHLFLNRLPMTIYVAIIRGKGAARAFAEPKKKLPVASTDCQNKIFALDKVAPGSIATCLMLVSKHVPIAAHAHSTKARWLLSADDNLQMTGQRTNVNYMAVYEEYLQKLLTGLDKKQKQILDVFRHWNAEFFPNFKSTDATDDGYHTAAAEQSQRVADLLAEEEPSGMPQDDDEGRASMEDERQGGQG